MFRLKQKHSKKGPEKYPEPNAGKIIAEQSLLRAVIGSVLVAILLSYAWASYSVSTNRVFPWFTIVMGALIGYAVQRFGKGLDWRFPVVAAVVACTASYFGNLMIGVVETGRYIEASPARVFAGLSMDTMENFFANTISPIDHIYAFSAAGVAAFFANRRLNRREVLAVRTLTGER